MNLDLFDQTNFTEAEFACRCGCGLCEVDLDFLAKLQQLRIAFDEPMTPNSGCRCAPYNRTLSTTRKSVDSSSHISVVTPEGIVMDVCCAVDIDIPGSRYRHDLLQANADLKVFNRYGIGASFIHYDSDHLKAPGVVWCY